MAKGKPNMSNLFKNSKVNLVVAVVIGIVVVVAGYLVLRSAAAGFFAALEGEQGTRSGNASVVSDPNASGGQAIQFDGPPTTPPPTGSCAAGTHVVGSADPWGGCWPGPNNTGVPAGTVLSAYTGPCTITTPNTVIDKKTINCTLNIKASGVVIKNSKINGLVDVDGASYSATIQDSEVSGSGNAGIGYTNITVIRANVHGAQHSVLCDDNCIVKDSWLHGQVFNNPDSHSNGVLSNGGNNIQLSHNTLYCEPKDVGPAGCTADVHLTGDFSAITNVTVDKNLFLSTPGGYCFTGGYETAKPYGKQASNIDVTNNIFKRGSNNKCGAFGAISNYNSAGGGVWENNKYEDGTTLNP